VLKDIL